MFVRLWKLYDRIGTKYDRWPRVHAKPKRMRWETYWRLRAQAEALDERLIMASGAWLNRQRERAGNAPLAWGLSAESAQK